MAFKFLVTFFDMVIEAFFHRKITTAVLAWPVVRLVKVIDIDMSDDGILIWEVYTALFAFVAGITF